MLGDLAVLHTPQVIVAGGHTAKGAFADSKDEISLRQNHVNFIVHHGNTLLRHCAQRGVQAGHTIGNTAVVLDVIVTVKVIRGLVQIVALHDIIEAILDQFTVFLGLIQIPELRAMEENELVHREVYAEVPPRVEYSLTELGKSLKPILDSMRAWGEAYKAKQ